jgi:hypothetical protein
MTNPNIPALRPPQPGVVTEELREALTKACVMLINYAAFDEKVSDTADAEYCRRKVNQFRAVLSGAGETAPNAGRAALASKALRESVEHEDRIERLDRIFYIRWTSGPNYEDAFLCVEDGEPDMRDFARVSFGQAALFKAAYQAAALSRLEASQPASSGSEPTPAMIAAGELAFMFAGDEWRKDETIRVPMQTYRITAVWKAMRAATPSPAAETAPDAGLAPIPGQRTSTDGEPFYCAVCGLGWNEYGACEEVDCRLETKAAALSRAGERP